MYIILFASLVVVTAAAPRYPLSAPNVTSGIAPTGEFLCPQARLIYPCRCTETFQNVARILCYDLKTATDLQRALVHLTSVQISTLMISDSDMDHMPAGILLPMTISEIHLSHTNINRVSFFFNDVSNTYPMPQLQDSLDTIRIEKVQGADRWDFSGLQDFKVLSDIIIVDSKFPRLSKSFGSLPKSVRSVSFENAEMMSIASGALARLQNLQNLKITGNPLDTFPRNALAKPAKELRILDLSHNRLEALSFDMFHEMPNLEVISLKGNKIASMVSTIFEKVNFIPEFQLDLSGNPFKCDCHLAWLNLLHQKNRGIFGKEFQELFCAAPENLFNERVLSIAFSDFQCPESYEALAMNSTNTNFTTPLIE